MEETGGVKLLGFWVSPFAQRVKWALKLKGIQYEYTEEDIYNKSPLVSKLNPVYGKVPVLVHNGKPISESIIILEYIDEVWKQAPLLPQDPYERAQARFWAKFAEEKVRQSVWEAVCSSGEEKQKAVKSAVEAFEEFEKELKRRGTKFFGGETIGFVDIVAGCISYQLAVHEEVGSIKILDSSKFPAISEWIKNFLNHPLINEGLPQKDQMFAYFSKRSKEIASRKMSHKTA
ncbi:probable glutathione S-transferase [Coffea eugenioides]|uniref:Probable glutathione S-transferase n=1 Tax=Coffea arabica TaxID=13443 RepID=A0A6P6WXP2_COFAR|nr:probable glutathione S-transferase [Coffea arabica]XP_027120223.1 probable glutathione S-transferase [Coffea arabica]XP_027165119.1 probable glutathione S-transferase [Coffea eugenioides]